MKQKASQLAKTIQTYFGEGVEEIAQETKFVQRQSPLTGLIFLTALVFGFIQNPKASLNNLVQNCADLGLEISPQGLDKRINGYALNFMQKMFAKAISHFKNKAPLSLEKLAQFSQINLVDSSILALPDSLQEEFSGCQGDGPSASVKIQLVFELLRGNLSQIDWQAGRQPDQKYQAYLDQVCPGSLTIVDLGYFVLENLQTIAAKPAYFLCRYLANTTIFSPDGHPLTLLHLLTSHPEAYFEIDILLGSKHRLPCRLVCCRLPQDVADRRRQRAKDNARRKKYALTKDYLSCLGWNIFVTNVPSSMLSIPQIFVLYGLRWQIELIFKLWKSYASLNHISGLRPERVFVELYAKMIGLVITHFIVAPFRFHQGREISPVKVRQIFQSFARDFIRFLPHSSLFLDAVTDMLARINRLGYKQNRSKDPNAFLSLALVSHFFDLSSLFPFLPFDFSQFEVSL